jgi:hypothetical protein
MVPEQPVGRVQHDPCAAAQAGESDPLPVEAHLMLGKVLRHVLSPFLCVLAFTGRVRPDHGRS